MAGELRPQSLQATRALDRCNAIYHPTFAEADDDRFAMDADPVAGPDLDPTGQFDMGMPRLNEITAGTDLNASYIGKVDDLTIPKSYAKTSLGYYDVEIDPATGNTRLFVDGDEIPWGPGSSGTWVT